jgi:hypothetical protein
MTNSQRLAKVRESLINWLENQEPSHAIEAPTVGHDSPPDSSAPAIERESILVRDEFFCGRRFYTADHHAVWFIEEDQLKIYHNSGELLCSLVGEEIDHQASESESSDSPDILRLPTLQDQAPESQDSIRRAA